MRLPGDRGTIAVEELAQRLRDAAHDDHEVRDAEVLVMNRQHRGVRVTAWLDVTADARLGETAAAASERIESVLNEQVGVRLAEPVAVRLRYHELRMRPRRTDG